MNFKESIEIKKVIDNSKNVLLALHQSPDPDSIVSNLLIARYLTVKNINHTIICADQIPKRFKEVYKLENVTEVKDVDNFKIDSFDLFIALDVNQPQRFGFTDKHFFNEVINIDHHYTENGFQGLKINDSSYSSTTEILFYLLEDFGYKFADDDLKYVLLGIITDTNAFSYGASAKLFRTVSRLMEMGVNYDEVDAIIYRNNSIDQIKFWGTSLLKIKVDKKLRFAYVALDRKTISKYPDIVQGTRTLADMFARTIKDTDFCVVMSESDEGFLKISVRARLENYGVMDLLKSLNGGGHFSGGGGKIDLPYREAVKETLRLTKKFAKNKLKI